LLLYSNFTQPMQCEGTNTVFRRRSVRKTEVATDIGTSFHVSVTKTKLITIFVSGNFRQTYKKIFVRYSGQFELCIGMTSYVCWIDINLKDMQHSHILRASTDGKVHVLYIL